jgi:hypothetical protein
MLHLFVFAGWAGYLGEMLLRAASYGFIRPALPSAAKAPPSGPGWMHEIKHDGYRVMVRRTSPASGCSPATGGTRRGGFR